MVIDRLDYNFVIGVAAMEGRGFYYPVDVAVAPDDKLFVLGRSHDGDTRGVQILMCDIESEYYGVFASHGAEDGQFIWPTSISISGDGLIYVTDEHLNRVSVFDLDGKFIEKWESGNGSRVEFLKPAGIATDKENCVWVVDNGASNIKKVSPQGECVLEFGQLGNGQGQFNMPWGITVSNSGDVYVADWGNDRIQQFTNKGKFVGEYGNNNEDSNNLRKPSDVSVDSNGYMYVTDWGNHRLQVISSGGSLVQNLRGDAGISKWAQDFLNSNPDENSVRAESDLEPKLDEEGWDLNEQSYHTEKFFWSPISVENYHDDLVIVVDRNRHRMQVLKINEDID